MFLRSMAGAILAMFVFGTPQAYAILGIRAARTAIAARKAEQMTSSSSAASSEAYAQEKARFATPAGYNGTTTQTSGSNNTNTLKR
jgi:hypothetical protein